MVLGGDESACQIKNVQLNTLKSRQKQDKSVLKCETYWLPRTCEGRKGQQGHPELRGDKTSIEHDSKGLPSVDSKPYLIVLHGEYTEEFGSDE